MALLIGVANGGPVGLGFYIFFQSLLHAYTFTYPLARKLSLGVSVALLIRMIPPHYPSAATEAAVDFSGPWRVFGCVLIGIGCALAGNLLPVPSLSRHILAHQFHSTLQSVLELFELHLQALVCTDPGQAQVLLVRSQYALQDTVALFNGECQSTVSDADWETLGLPSPFVRNIRADWAVLEQLLVTLRGMNYALTGLHQSAYHAEFIKRMRPAFTEMQRAVRDAITEVDAPYNFANASRRLSTLAGVELAKEHMEAGQWVASFFVPSFAILSHFRFCCFVQLTLWPDARSGFQPHEKAPHPVRHCLQRQSALRRL